MRAPSRREILLGGGAGLAALTLPGARAAASTVSGADLKFVFLWAYGGWDPTIALAPLHDHARIVVDPASEPARAGDLAYTHADDRPSVDDFYARYHARSVVLHGLTQRSVGHTACLRLAYTGDTTGTSADWAARLAAAAADRYPLPQVVARGPQFPGTYGPLVTRVGTSGQVAALLDGTLLDAADRAYPQADAAVQKALADLVAARARTRVTGSRGSRQSALFEAHLAAEQRARQLEAVASDVRWGRDGELATQVDLGLDLLRLGLTRCLTLAHDRLESWDSHADNFSRQSAMQEALFAGLTRLLDGLAATPGAHAPTLADETVVVVMSEMGRTPHLNGGGGKDHWGVTSCLLVGPNLRAGRAYGGWTESAYGMPLDFTTAETSATGRVPTGADLGATLLALGDVEPDVRTGVPIFGMIA